ncbi:uncharacterized protein LOC123670692 [Harmonia axyridis]|uniref:uncharacterized protein LOC123670692 n=1 Tax=Harmonia axyridis TaxID=115357 RepID=UPI001E2757E6|nr:uncharacterized protein LOC123670692 [Harmonia axyridis]XP_045460176.1 uncharacterized protein LOC123670692 [Harmonia axyridis]
MNKFFYQIKWYPRNKGPVLVLLLSLMVTSNLSKEKSFSRQKRFLWITEDGRLALPPGTTLVMTPSLSLPFVRYPPDGFFSNMTISLPFTIDFNKLGLTDNENPYGVLPPLLARSMGRAAGNLLGDYIGKFMNHRRTKRGLKEDPPKLPREHQNVFHGGERALLYFLVEDFLENFGMNGKACLLRAICEVHAYQLGNLGLLGEMLKLFLTASKSPFAEILSEYVDAENNGKGKFGGPSECWPYMKDCPKSLFAPSRHNHYSGAEQDNSIKETDLEKNQKVTFNPSLKNM